MPTIRRSRVVPISTYTRGRIVRKARRPVPVRVIPRRGRGGGKYLKQRKLKFDSQLKQVGQDNSGTVLQMAPNAASRVTSYVLNSIALGDLLTQRGSTKILNRFLILNMSVSNFSATGRYVRVFILGLRGSQSPADTTNWTDLYIDSAFNKSGPTGEAGNLVLRPNRDEYKVYYDRTIRIPGTADGQSNARKLYVNKKLNVITDYLYNSTVARDGPLYLVWTAFEEAGTSASADFVNVNFRWAHYFQDVHR